MPQSIGTRKMSRKNTDSDQNVEHSSPGAQEPSTSSLESLMSGLQSNSLFREYENVVGRFQSNGSDVNANNENTGVVGESSEMPERQQSDEARLERSKDFTYDSNTKEKSRDTKPSLTMLKEAVPRPELVEWWDVDAKDPALLYALKSAPGAVPVPSTWQGRHESSNTRAQRPYRLPDNIKETGIMMLRDVVAEDSDTLRQKTRERVQPKLGRLDMDYRKLHAAFFGSQTKPSLSEYGQTSGQDSPFPFNPDLRPGNLSEKLRSALGLRPDALPPWAASVKKNPNKSWPSKDKPQNLGKRWGEMILDFDEDEPDIEYQEDEDLNSTPDEEDVVPARKANESEILEEAPNMPAARQELYREVTTTTGGSSYLGPVSKYSL